MKKSLKAALAAGAGATLLLGGAGTLAYWSDSETIGGSGISSGTLRLDPNDLDVVTEGVQGCTPWTLDGDTTYTAGTTLLVPGDVLSRNCSYTVEASGAHLTAKLGLAQPTFADPSNVLVTSLNASAAYELDGTVVADQQEVTSADDGKVLTADVNVTFTNVDNLTGQGLAATLEAITVSVTQQAHP